MSQESILFSPVRIKGLDIPNRFVRSATHDFMAGRDGSVTERQVELFSSLAEGGVGLVITGHTYVSPEGKASLFQLGIDKDDFLPGLKKIPQAVHKFPSRIFLQLSHAGRQTKPKLCGGTPLAPSAVYEPVFKVMPQEMSGKQIERTIYDFIQAARRAKVCGFDGVQIHIAHGYLLSSFLSSYTNQRKDKWGGSLHNRMRIVVEIIRGIKESTGFDFPLMAKLNSVDWLPQGLTLEESIEIGRILEEEGLDAVEVSGGMSEAGETSIWKGVRPPQKEGYFVDNASLIKKAVSIPVLGLGGIRSFSVMEEMVKKGKVDLISMSRPFIRDPFLVQKFRRREKLKSDCISCNKCFNPRGIKCAQLA